MKRQLLTCLGLLSLLFSKGQSTTDYRTPEVTELFNVACLLTDAGRTGVNGLEVMDTTQPYFTTVMAHFGSYRRHPLVALLQAKLQQDLSWFISNQNFSHTYRFDADTLVNDSLFVQGRVMAQEFRYGNAMRQYKKQFEDFARQTGFRKFYQTQQPVYNRMHAAMRALAPADRMIAWLNNRFGKLEKDFIVVSSPLITGNHSTFEYKHGTVYIVVSNGNDEQKSKLTQAEKQARYAGILFTEIDHHYCNPAADMYKKAVDSAFSFCKKWVDDTRPSAALYKTPMKVFNEYFTHGTFLLYVKDTYPAAVYESVKSARTKSKEQTNGWIRFGDFCRQFEELYASQKQITQLLPQLLAWCAGQ